MNRVRVVTPDQMRVLERRAGEVYGLSEDALMENAGRAVAAVALQLLLGNQDPAAAPLGLRWLGLRGGGGPAARRPEGGVAGPVAVVAGKGKNGGDGLVAARYLAGAGCPVAVWCLGEPEPGSLTARHLTALERLAERGQPLTLVKWGASGGCWADQGAEGGLDGVEVLAQALSQCALVIDAVLGTGLAGAAKGLAALAIEAINRCGRPVLAVDIPSGLKAEAAPWDEGAPCVRAEATVTMGLPKPGLLIYPGAECTGYLWVADLGLPRAFWEEGEAELELITPELARSWLPGRPPNSHKGSFGHLLAVGGSAGMAGAIALCGEAALRSGAGRVTLGVPHGIWSVVASYRRELMVYGWAEDAEGRLAPAVVPGFLERAGQATAVVLGPGMGVGEGGADLLAAALPHLACPLVVDADGLNILAREPERFRPLVRRRWEENRPPAVLTPHPGELGRLLGLAAQEVQRDRLGAARRAAREWGAVVVLKGAGTVVSLPWGQAYLNPTGGPHLATAGTGDVLAGVIGGLLAQGLSPERAAALGVYLHGLAGDLAAAGETEILLAGQVAAWLGPARRYLEGGGRG